MAKRNLADQLFNAMTAVNIKYAAQLRPLTQGEKSLLEQTEAKAGPMLSDIEKAIQEVRRGQQG